MAAETQLFRAANCELCGRIAERKAGCGADRCGSLNNRIMSSPSGELGSADLRKAHPVSAE